jgi:hypothetical protein
VKWTILLAAFVLFITFLLGITGKWDYEEARRQECDERYHQAYDPDKDICYNENLEKR